MRTFFAALLIAVGVLASPVARAGAPAGAEKVTIRGEGGWKLDAFYVKPAAEGAGKAPAVILTHMLNRTKEDWTPLVGKLSAAGFAVVAYDMRGHGKSVDATGKPGSWKTFKAADWLAAEKDVGRVRDWLLGKKKDAVDPKRVALVGASIGANLSLRALAGLPEVRGAVLLSPGLDYRGVKTREVMGKLKESQLLFMYATKDDKAAYEGTWALAKGSGNQDVAAGLQEVKTFTGSEHGTVMFTSGKNVQAVLDEILGALGKITGPADAKPKNDVKGALDRVL